MVCRGAHVEVLRVIDLWTRSDYLKMHTISEKPDWVLAVLASLMYTRHGFYDEIDVMWPCVPRCQA